ncbi:signal peptide peptidase SppA [Massilia terrae]|uniref:Signal peptide peptidase SppA n=1 Tax=Massilia terrae TaxID=1811224 RepID=A0ABT2CU53_9BURK|nr:signal peptide peptidase SppA [Massilia terrae]MCS0656618.1 signal peptide peptidase SppA [Massilia terrae]
MSDKPKSSLRRGVGALWRALDATRRGVMNLLFLVVLIALLWAIFGGGGGPRALGPKTALVLELKGQLVEQTSGSVAETLAAGLGAGEVRRTIQLRDVLTVMDAAAKDPNIGSVLLSLDELEIGGLASMHEFGAAIDRVKAAGKQVVAWGGSYDQKRYLVASHASEVYVHPMGMVLIQGFGRYRNYYRDALDKLGVTVNLMKVGTYKSFAEPYIGNGPSQAAVEADTYLYNGLWNSYTGEVEKDRKLAAGTLKANIDQLPQRMEAAGGDAAKVALDAHLVDGIKTKDEVRALLIKRGVYDEHIKSFRQISFADYLSRHPDKMLGDAVGVIVAEGDITEGNGGPGSVGGISTANLIRQARNDDSIKSVVLRVNSPGGSAYGSELIRRELELTRLAGKPVVVSMGDVAASGGYWISMASDEVIADPGTVTGSIGVFAILPTADKVVDKLGIHTAGVTTTWLADAYNPLRPLDPRFGQLVQQSINHIYREFTGKAAAARKTTPEKIDEVGQGRVWTGGQAKERGLVDTLGSYQDALNSAARRGKLGSDYRVAYIERPTSAFERFIGKFGVSADQLIHVQVKLGLLPAGIENALPPQAVSGVARELGWLGGVADGKKPFEAVTHCMCAFPAM